MVKVSLNWDLVEENLFEDDVHVRLVFVLDAAFLQQKPDELRSTGARPIPDGARIAHLGWIG